MPAQATALLERATAFDCEPRSESDIDERAGIVARVDCETGDADIGPLMLRSFADADSLREWWRSRSKATSAVELDDDACVAVPGARRWGFGTVACLQDDGVIQVRWTDSRANLLGVVESTSVDIPTLYTWWFENARRLGRTSDAATPEPIEPQATPKPQKTPAPRKLVRVPGRPTAATCSGSVFPLPDEWDRTWRIRKVRLENKEGYERVILQLLRTGRNRSRVPTEARAQRMDVSEVPRAVPSAGRPSRGGVAVVVELGGIDDAPGIRGYRPKDVDLVKQVSVVRDGSGYAVVVSVPGGTCYQMRIPIWGTSATGKERRAQIFIDLQRK